MINPKNLGVVPSFKKAASLCQAKNYIAFSDQDDVWHKNKLQENYNAISNYPYENIPVLVYSDAAFIDAFNNSINKSFMNVMGIDKYKHTYETVLFGSMMLGCTIMINPTMNKYLLKMPEQTSFNHDAWMSLISFSFGVCHFIQMPLLDYRKHALNSTLSNFETKTRFDKIVGHVKSIFNDKKYLSNEIELANKFLKNFESKLTPSKISQIKKFIELGDRSYFMKKLYFEYVFFKYWKNRL